MFSKIYKALTQPYKIIVYLNNTKIAKFIPDKICVKCLYRSLMGQKLDLKNPKKFTEKIQWLKLYDHRSQYTILVDKYAVKKYVSDLVGEQYVIPLLGAWNDVEEIDFKNLPNQFVLKTTHDSKGIVICKDKNNFDETKAKQFIKQHLDNDFYYLGREWPYKHVKPQVIAEKYMEDIDDGEVRDYKFFCFGGEPRILYIAQGRGLGNETVADFFDMDFNFLDLKIDHNNSKNIPHKPYNFDLMKELAKKLSKDIPHVRVDFYEINGKVYFGELTFFHCSGFAKFQPEKWDDIFGEWIVLPNKNKLY